MDSTLPKLIFPTFILFFLLCPSLLRADNDMLSYVCGKTEDKSRCLAILRSDPAASSAESWVDLSAAILKTAISNGKETKGFLKTLSEKTKNPIISRCATSSYDKVVRSFEAALEYLQEDALSANLYSDYASDGANDCKWAMIDNGVDNPEVSSRNDLILLLSRMAYAATYRLRQS